MQPEALCNAGETIAAHDFGARKAGRDPVHQRLQPGRAPSEVQRVDGVGLHAGDARGLAGRLHDAFEVGLDRAGGLRFEQSGGQTAFHHRQVDLRAAVQGDVDLGLLGRRGQRVAQALLHGGYQPRVVARIGVPALDAAQLGEPRRAVHGVDQMPGGEVEVNAAGHFARSSLARAPGPQRAVAQQRQDGLQFDMAVEIGARQMHAVVGQDVVAAPGAAVCALCAL